MGGYPDGIAAAFFADGGDVNRGAAMTANDVLPILAIALGAADLTGVQSRAPAVGLLDDHKAQTLPVHLQGEEMEVAVLYFAERNAHVIPYGGDRARCWW